MTDNNLHQVLTNAGEVELVKIILERCLKDIQISCLDVPLGLLLRIIISNTHCTEQLQNILSDGMNIYCPYFHKVLVGEETPAGVKADVLSICGQLIRTNANSGSVVVSRILFGDGKALNAVSKCLGSKNPAVRSKMLNIIGNLLRKNCSQKQNVVRASFTPEIFDTVLQCLEDSEGLVRQSCALVLGNLAYTHNDVPTHRGDGDFTTDVCLQRALPGLMSLLNDSSNKIRSNASLTLGNMSKWGTKMNSLLIKYKAPEKLVDVAIMDMNTNVKISSLIALRTFCAVEVLQNAINEVNGVKKLGQILRRKSEGETNTPRTPRISSARIKSANTNPVIVEHVKKLIEILSL